MPPGVEVGCRNSWPPVWPTPQGRAQWWPADAARRFRHSSGQGVEGVEGGDGLRPGVERADRRAVGCSWGCGCHCESLVDQVAQKLHAASSPGSERAKDLVDLQLLDKGEDLDLTQVAETCIRLFDHRRQQPWPSTIRVGNQWDTLYAETAEDTDVLPTVEEAVAWANELIRRIAAV